MPVTPNTTKSAVRPPTMCAMVVESMALIVSGAKGVRLTYAPRSPLRNRGTQTLWRQDVGRVFGLEVLHPGERQTSEQTCRTITGQQALGDEQELHLLHLCPL